MLSFPFCALKQTSKKTLGANASLRVTVLNSGDTKEEDLVPALLELQDPLGALWEDKALSTKAGDSGEPSLYNETVNGKAWT